MISEVYKFADFTLSPAKRTLFREGAEIKLRDKDFDVLLFLLEKAPNLCSFDAIMRAVWGETNVENSSIEKAIANIRKSLMDDARQPRFIKTVRTKGYLFFGDIERVREGLLEEPGGYTEHFYPKKIEAEDQPRNTAYPRDSKSKKALWGLVIALPMVLGLLWWTGARTWINARDQVVFADDFSSRAINPDRWKIKGKSVRLIDGTVKVSVDETDNPGTLRSEFFSIDPAKPITIESRLRVTFSQNMKDKVYFGGWFGLIPKTTNLEKISVLEDSAEANSLFCGVRYMNYDYSESSKDTSGNDYQNIKAEGFFLVREGAYPNTKAGYASGKVGERIKPVWGEWFDQKIVYNPLDGLMAYFVDGEKRGEFNVGRLQAKDGQIRFEIIPWGWWPNHSMEIDYIRVSQ
jgi:DNA-binding winged helix-turn-helix (wHTH) protein